MRLPSVPGADTTLDIGCGCGAATLEAAQLAPNGLVVGTSPPRGLHCSRVETLPLDLPVVCVLATARR